MTSFWLRYLATSNQVSVAITEKSSNASYNIRWIIQLMLYLQQPCLYLTLCSDVRMWRITDPTVRVQLINLWLLYPLHNKQ